MDGGCNADDVTLASGLVCMAAWETGCPPRGNDVTGTPPRVGAGRAGGMCSTLAKLSRVSFTCANWESAAVYSRCRAAAEGVALAGAWAPWPPCAACGLPKGPADDGPPPVVGWDPSVADRVMVGPVPADTARKPAAAKL